MSAVNVNALYPIFTDIDGQPLEDGYVWIGVTGLEPQANPQTAYWDAALTLTATQPVRTRGGYPLNGTTIGRLFTAAPYSIKVQNKRTSTIATDLSASSGTGVGSISFGSTGLTPATPTDGDVVVAGTLAVANGGTGVTTATGTGSVVRATSPTVTGPTVSTGNLAFSGAAQRITGDMSNATLANRLAFQSNVTNGNTDLQIIPNGTAVVSGIRLNNNSDTTNAGYIRLSLNTSEATVAVDRNSISGTYLPMTLWTGGSERVRVDTSGNVGIGAASPTFRLVSANNTTDGGWMYSSGAVSVLGLGGYANAGDGAFQIRFDRATGVTTLNGGNRDTPAARVTIDSSGNVGIGTASPGALLDVGGGGLRVASTGAMTSGNLADAVGYKGTPLNEQSTAYTLVIGDMGKSIVHPISDNNARTFTIPANGTVAFPVGTTITFINMINTVTIAITTDTMYLAGAGTTGSRTLAAYGMATAVKMTSTSWIISGNGLS